MVDCCYQDEGYESDWSQYWTSRNLFGRLSDEADLALTAPQQEKVNIILSPLKINQQPAFIAGFFVLT